MRKVSICILAVAGAVAASAAHATNLMSPQSQHLAGLSNIEKVPFNLR